MAAPPVSAAAPLRGHGLAAGIAAYVLWGLFPLYFRLIDELSPLEIVGWRIVFSAATLALLLPLAGQARELLVALRDRRLMRLLLPAALLLFGNWLAYVLAVTGGNALDASLGYFMCPLVMVALGVVALRERLNTLQSLAVTLVVLAIALLVGVAGVVPKIAIFLAVSFGIYGLLRKCAAVGAVVGLLVECLLTAPLAVALLLWVAHRDGLGFPSGRPGLDLLVLVSGAVTVAPLVLFGYGARRLRLSTVGLLQYIAPSMIFVEAVWLFGEPLSPWRLAAFALIWTALALYTFDGLRRPAKH
jgi:chloramphenicol-sensitive protein RarD